MATIKTNIDPSFDPNPGKKLPTKSRAYCGSNPSIDTIPSADIEKEVGMIIGEYSCEYSNVDGSLFIGNSALYFQGSNGAYTSYWDWALSGFLESRTTLLIHWNRILKVTKLDQSGIQIACIESSSGRQALARYEFHVHLVDVDRVWLLLLSLQNENIQGTRLRTALPSTKTIRSPMCATGTTGRRRCNSDPLLSSMLRYLDESFVVDFSPACNTVSSVSVPMESTPDDTSESIASSSLIIPPPTPRSTSHNVGDSFVFATAGLDMQEVEKIAGRLSLQPIQCSLDDVKGKLYVGNAGIYFFGRKYFWDKKELFLSWNCVRQIQIIDAKTSSESTADTPTGSVTSNSYVCVGIRILANEQQEHRFVRMDQADRVWATLVAMHNENLTESVNSRRPSQFIIVRRNSDPSLNMHVPAPPPTDQTSSSSMTSDKHETTIDDNKDMDDAVKNVDANSLIDLSTSEPYENIVVNDHVLHCSLDRAFDHFLRDDAVYSFARFLESRGDSNVNESPWQELATGAFSRVIHYVHPVNAPMAPPTAKARKEQVYRLRGDQGLSVWTTTIVDDVPMTDCFYVKDRITVTSLEVERVQVRMEFELHFTKSTMFKGIIRRTTSNEFASAMKAHAHFMASALGDTATVNFTSTIPTQDRNETSSILLPASSSIFFVLLIILILQIWILLELRKVNASSNLMQQPSANGASARLDSEIAHTCRGL